jgi:hypothetical protein
MTDDQFPMTNAGRRAKHIMVRDENFIRDWSFVIGIWSFPRLLANVFVKKPV